MRGWLHTKEPAARSRHEAGNQSPRRPSDKKGSRGGRGSSQETLPAPTAPASAAQRKGTAKRHGQRTDGRPDRRPDPAGAKPSRSAPPPRSPGVWWVPRCAGKNGAAGWETKLGWAPRNLGSVRGRPAWGWRLGWGGGERGNVRGGREAGTQGERDGGKGGMRRLGSPKSRATQQVGVSIPLCLPPPQRSDPQAGDAPGTFALGGGSARGGTGSRFGVGGAQGGLCSPRAGGEKGMLPELQEHLGGAMLLGRGRGRAPRTPRGLGGCRTRTRCFVG